MLHVWHAKATYVNITHSVAMMMVIKWDSDLQNLQTVKLKQDLISRFKHTKQTKNCQNIGSIIKTKYTITLHYSLKITCGTKYFHTTKR